MLFLVPTANVTKLEDLSNELVYEIFEYLDFYDACEAFSTLNNRYQDLVLNSSIPMNIQVSLMSKSTCQRYTTDMILPNRNRIHSLHISNQFIYDLPLSPIGMLTEFTRLERLVLDKIPREGVETILIQLASLPRLSSLSIFTNDYRTYNDNWYARDIRTTIYTQIFRLSALKYCELSLKGCSNNQALPVATDDFSPIEHLVIVHSITLNELYSLLSYVPQLRRFDAHSLQNSLLTPTNLSPRVLNHLTDISLTLSIPFDRFAQLIMDLFHKIQVLRITIAYGSDGFYADSKNWERLILSHMPSLRIFDIRHEDWSRHVNHHDGANNPFISSFWMERQWFFTQHCCQRRNRDYKTFYSTNPYRYFYI